MRILLFLILAILTSQLSAQKTVVAKNGDGIYSILRRSGIKPTAKTVELFKQVNKGKITPKGSVYKGTTYTIPDINSANNTPQTPTTKKATTATPPKAATNKKYIDVPIFGSKDRKVEIIDNSLAGATYYLIAGHGGPDPGAWAKVEGKVIREDEYAYDVTLRMGRELIRHGADVYFITRDPNDGIRSGRFLKEDKDERCYPNSRIPLNQFQRLKQRTDAVNKLYRSKPKGSYQRAVSNHIDARTKSTDIDIFFYHYKGSKDGKALAYTMRQTIKEKYEKHRPGRGYDGTVGTRNLYVIRETLPPIAFLELGNINHTRDRARIMMESNREVMGKWLAEGLMKDYSNWKKKNKK